MIFFGALFIESLLIFSTLFSRNLKVFDTSFLFFKVTISMFALYFGIAYLRAQIARKHPGYSYAKGGTLVQWYDETYAYNTEINWLKRVLANLEAINIDLARVSILVSPSGNKGRYEFELSKDFPQSIFIVTDIEIPEDHINSSGNFHYLAEDNDAINIGRYLNDIAISTVDYIWDIKGALWHNYKGKHLDDMLRAFASVLKPSGCIIIDAYEVNNFMVYINSLKKSKNRKNYLEDSTFQKIKRALKKNSFFKDNFTLIIVGDDEVRMAILKKK